MIDLPPMTPPIKRSVTIDGHRTSVSLEEAFWKALGAQAARQGLTRATLIGRIDHARPPRIGLATALRLYVLARAGEAAPGAVPHGQAAPGQVGTGQVTGAGRSGSGPFGSGHSGLGHPEAGNAHPGGAGPDPSPPDQTASG